MENKIIIRTISGCKSSKTIISAIKILLVEALDEVQDNQNIKGKKVNELWQKLFD